MMLVPNLFLLYVQSPKRSSMFYAELLGQTPVEDSDTFAMFKLPSGMMLGLWAQGTVEPPVHWQGAEGELCFAVADQDMVKQQFVRLQAQGLELVQALTPMDFGLTFVVLDPDGHRLRVYCPR